MKIYKILFCLLILITFLAGGCSGKDYVSREFDWLIHGKINLENPESEEVNWYKIYALNEDKLNEIMSNDFKSQGYSGWKDCKQGFSIGNKKSYYINGYVNKIKSNIKNGSDDFNQIALYIDLTNKKLILFYGKTYGM